MEKTFKSWLLSNLLIFMWLTFGLIAIIGFIIGSITSNEDLMMLSLYSCVSIPLSLICSIVGPLFQLAALFITIFGKKVYILEPSLPLSVGLLQLLLLLK